LFISEQFGFEDFIFESNSSYILVCLLEKVSASRGHIYEVEIEETAEQKKEA